MNAKKVGLITAGVVASVLAVSPLAWAADEPSAVAPENCSFSQTGDDVSGTGPAASPQASNNQGTYGQCSTFGQNNNQDNGVGNTFNGQPIPAPPAFPGLTGVPDSPLSGMSGGLPSGVPAGLPAGS